MCPFLPLLGSCSHFDKLLGAAELGGEVIVLEEFLVGGLEQAVAIVDLLLAHCTGKSWGEDWGPQLHVAIAIAGGRHNSPRRRLGKNKERHVGQS